MTDLNDPDVADGAQQVLKRAAAYVKKGWVQGMMAKSKTGLRAEPEAPEACEFCMLGAIERARRDLDAKPEHEHAARMLAHESVGQVGLAGWNDDRDRTREDVVEALLRASMLASQRMSKPKMKFRRSRRR